MKIPEEQSLLSVLIADVNFVDANILQIILESRCQKIVTEQNAQATVDTVLDSIIEDTPFDAVFLSDNLQGMKSVQVAKLLRDAGYVGSIVATAAEFSMTLKDELTVAGCNAFVQKPFTTDKLLKAI